LRTSLYHPRKQVSNSTSPWKGTRINCGQLSEDFFRVIVGFQEVTGKAEYKKKKPCNSGFNSKAATQNVFNKNINLFFFFFY
jgi:hypothetical protein